MGSVVVPNSYPGNMPAYFLAFLGLVRRGRFHQTPSAVLVAASFCNDLS